MKHQDSAMIRVLNFLKQNDLALSPDGGERNQHEK